jgi:argininosuccinate lyase
MEDLEEYYENENEKNKEEFFRKLEKKEEINQVEKEYKNKSRSLRRIYEKEYKNNLEKERKKEIEKIKNKVKPKKLTPNKTYEVKSIDLELNLKEKTGLWISSRNYRFGRKLNDIYEKIMPNSIIYFNYKLKKKIKQIFNDIISFIADTSSTIVNGFGHFFRATGDFLVSFSTKLGENITHLINKIFKKKKEEKKENGNGKKENSDSPEEKSSSS